MVEGSKKVSAAKKSSIDGISHYSRKSSKSNQNTSVDSKKTSVKEEAKPVKEKGKKEHSKAPHLKHRAQRSKTLHRSSLKSPKLKADTPAPASVKPKESSDTRLERALKVSRSAALSRFPISDFRRSDSPKKGSEQPSNVVVEKTPLIPAIKPAVAAQTEPTPQKTSKPQKTPKLRRHLSLTGYIISGLTLLALIGYVVYLNVPAFSIKVASSRAGFSANVPEYTPTGYKIDGPVQYSPGVVTIHFKAGDDDKDFSLVQQPSNWDSLALKESYVATKTDQPAVTQQYNGLTLYLFEGKVAWVNAGKLFEIDTKDSQLGLDEIQKLATSL